ncbi:MAG: DnaK suppressor protein [Candidatus Parcubacteria bacterium]|nr:TraR/DksA C4-type zinc finger protein [Patescibacteria group bacterium]BCX15901.1 MAG: DnaK suppressor protein [Candidatus Parcubacteria bacterium]
MALLDNLKKYKSLLLEEREKVLAEIKEAETPVDMGDEPGTDDETEEAEEYFNKASTLASLKTKLGNIESALIKIEKGTYGICEDCGKEIEEEVLEMTPEARYCKECNKKR